MMRVLVTGGAGYIGSHVVRGLAERGDRVVVLDSLETGHRAAVGDVPLVVGDIADEALVASVLARERIEAVVHFAAHKSVEESVAAPGRYFRNNVDGTVRLLDGMAAAGVGILVFSSSCAVYGLPDRSPVDEDAPLRPENPYGESKLLAERLLRWYEPLGIRSVALRYFNAAGAALDGSIGEDPRGAANLIPLVLSVALGRAPALRIFGTDYPTPDGTAVRDYVHVLDLADAHLAALDRLAGGAPSAVLNVGTGRGSSVREIVEVARRITGAEIPVELAPRRAGDTAAIWADARRAGEVLGWQARYDLAEILDSAWRWQRSHPDGYADGPGR